MDRASALQTSILTRVPGRPDMAALSLAERELTVSTLRTRKKPKTDHCGVSQCNREAKSYRE
jgi:hypothetical protein